MSAPKTPGLVGRNLSERSAWVAAASGRGHESLGGSARGFTRRRAMAQFAAFLAGSPLLRGQFVSRASHERIPALDEVATIFEFEPIARARITQADYDYIAGGVESEATLRRNQEAFNWVRLLPRAFGDAGRIDLASEVLGQRLASPILISPTAGHQRLHPDGEMETHRGATVGEALMMLSNNSSYPLEKVIAAAEGPMWAQLYVREDHARARELVTRAADAGFRAIVLTVDSQYGSLRERLLHDRHLNNPPPQAAESSRGERRRRRESPYGLQPQDPSLTWSFIDELRSWSKLPILLKGILSAEDAGLAVERGADGIVVSNHGARYLQDAPATFEALPEIVDAVRGRIAVVIDGGIRRGSDVLKALAVGANAVSVGRPALWGLGAFGQAGVERVLRMLQAELALEMANTGCSRVSEIGRGLVELDYP